MNCGNLPDRIRKVAIYGRVSTEHEAQLSAMENQKQWFGAIVMQHPNWTVVDSYYDEGITGTSASKRPEFMRMIEDARANKFDLIVTREVCRFARNTIDTLTVVRELQRLAVEVYFIQDNIWTCDGDGELRLTIMATLAQEESRKVSERVLAGQKVSRENLTIYGNGNILGYKRVGKTYVIDPEQARIVRMIFELYASGCGYQKISNTLVSLGCKNTKDEVRWDATRIGRILKNATYKGYVVYNKSHSDGYLTQKRVNHCEEDYVCIKGNFEPIVSEELWQLCADIRAKRSIHCLGKDGKKQKFGRNEPRSVWSDKLRCSCGAAFRRFRWRTNRDGREMYGYQCYRQTRNVRARYYLDHGLDATRVCQSKSIPGWHIDLMTKMVFQQVWSERKEAILMACQMIEECAEDTIETSVLSIANLEKQIERLEKSLGGLRRMRSLEEISREEYQLDSLALKEEIQQLQAQIELLSSQTRSQKLGIDMEEIRSTLEQWIDLSAPTVSDPIIDQFILQVVVIDDNTYNYTLDLAPQIQKNGRLRPSEIALKMYHHTRNSAEYPIDTKLARHILDPQDVCSFSIDAHEAEAYCKQIGMRFFEKKWTDKRVIISV